MNNYPRSQNGLTLISIILLLAILGFFVLFGLRLFPIYNEHLGVKSSMQSVANQPFEKRKNVKEVRKLFLKSTGLNSVYYFKEANVKDHVTLKKSKDGKKMYMNVKYENSNKLFSNIFLTVKTDETIEMTGGK